MAFTPAQVEQLLRPVNPRRVQRDNHGMSHLAAYDVSAHLTRIFGFGGWSKHILALELVAEDGIIDQGKNRIGWWVTYRCTMRLEVGAWSNEDGATGSASNLPDRGDAHDFALKNAISYALKRCAKDLGDQFGLSLYNKGSVAPLVIRTLASPGQGPDPADPQVDDGVPDLAPDWDEQPRGRPDGLPTNRDGSLSRSQTTDAEKDQAGVMTDAQLREHTALGGGNPKTPKAERGKVTRMKPCDCSDCAINPGGPWMIPSGNKDGQHAGGHATPDDEPWLSPEGWVRMDGREQEPGSVAPQQQRAIHSACTGMDRDTRLATISDIVGRQVASSNELSYTEAATVLAKLSGVRA